MGERAGGGGEVGRLIPLDDSPHPLLLLPRASWADATTPPPRGHQVTPLQRRSWVIHHTATLDSDDPDDAPLTPSLWETDDEIAAHMRFLSTVRPDLGLDVPYNFVVFVRDGSPVLAEGRGLYRKGAQVANTNTTTIGIAFAGNFHTAPPPDDPLCWTWGRVVEWIDTLHRLAAFPSTILPHSHFKETLCPGGPLLDLIEEMV